MEDDEREILSLRSRRRRSSISLTSCFSGAPRHVDSHEFSTLSSPSPRRSPGSWFRSRKSHEPTEIRGRCMNLMSRMGRHRRHASADFSYDPLSYALNFEDDEAGHEDDLPVRNFAARLPSPWPSLTPSSTAERRRNLDFQVERAMEARRNVDVPDLTLTAESEMRSRLVLPTPKGATAMVEARRSFDLSASRAEAIAEVRRSLEMPSPRAATETMETRRSVDLPASRAAALAEVRRSLEDGSPTASSREILVEIC